MKYIKRPVFSGLFRSNDGATIIEFAVVAPVFFLIMFGMMEFGLYMYHKITVERIAVDVSRISSIQKISDSSCPTDTSKTTKERQIDYIKCVVKEKSSALINGDRTQVQIANLSAGETSKAPDICLNDPEHPSSETPKEDCKIYEDVDGDGNYTPSGGINTGSTNVAGVGDVIEVRISYPWSIQMPFMSQFFGGPAHNGVVMISESTIIRNE